MVAALAVLDARGAAGVPELVDGVQRLALGVAPRGRTSRTRVSAPTASSASADSATYASFLYGSVTDNHDFLRVSEKS